MPDNWTEPETSERAAVPDADRPIFEAHLTPFRSLGPRGFAVTMILFGTICFGAGLAFAAQGAWPIFGFLGLDVVILWFAFKMSYQAGKAREEVFVSRNDLTVRKISPQGRIREARFVPAWTSFKVARMEEIGITRMDLESRGRSVEIGGFLNLDDRESFAKAMKAALSEAKRG